MGFKKETSKESFQCLQAAKGSELSQWQKRDSNTTAAWLWPLTKDLPSTKELILELLLRDFSLPWQGWNWAGLTL